MAEVSEVKAGGNDLLPTRAGTTPVQRLQTCAANADAMRKKVGSDLSNATHPAGWSMRLQISDLHLRPRLLYKVFLHIEDV